MLQKCVHFYSHYCAENALHPEEKSSWKRHMMCTKAPEEYRLYCIVRMMITVWTFPAMAFHGDLRLSNVSRFRFWVWKLSHILSLYLLGKRKRLYEEKKRYLGSFIFI